MELEKRNFIQIINMHKGTIRSLCKAYYDSIEDQKDVFQDVVLQLWKSFDTFRGESEINTWIYRVGLNTILCRRRKETRSLKAEPIDSPHLHIASKGADDNIELLTLIFQSLKEVDRAMVMLYLEGYKYREIAEILQQSPTNVATRFNRIKSQLKLKFNDESYASR